MVADAKTVPVLNGAALDTLSRELNTVRGAHIHHVVGAAAELDLRVLTRDIGVANGEIRTLFAAPNDEALFGDRVGFALVLDAQLERWSHLACGGQRRRRERGRGCWRSSSCWRNSGPWRSSRERRKLTGCERHGGRSWGAARL